MEKEKEKERPPQATDSAEAAANPNASNGEAGTDLELLRHRVDVFISKADELEKRVMEVTQFYENKRQNPSKGGKVGARVIRKGGRKKQVGDEQPEAGACSKRMQELMRQLGTILRQIFQHKWCWPFMQPVDVEGLNLHDYYEIVKKPMDLGTIRDKMDAKDDSGYKNVREIYDDVKLVFTNAMTYNSENNDYHVMAKFLMEKFEEKWKQLLPKVINEEAREKAKAAQAQPNSLTEQAAATAKMAKDTSSELNELCAHLEEFREVVLRNCRKMSTEEKRKIANGLSKLPPVEIQRALEIITQHNSSLSCTEQCLNIDIDAQSESTLWRLKFFVKEKLEMEAKKSLEHKDQQDAKRKICDALAKSAKKRSRKQPTIQDSITFGLQNKRFR